MNTNARFVLFGLLMVVFVGSGCASTSAPSNWQSTAETMQQEAYGGWVDVTLTTLNPTARNRSELQGELIAANEDSLHVLQPTSPLTSVAWRSVQEVELAMFDANASTLGYWSLGGTVSTFSHGFFLVFSAPVWLITGTTFTVLQSRRPIVTDPELDLLRRYARFPQGLPSEVSRGSLTAKMSGTQ